MMLWLPWAAFVVMVLGLITLDLVVLNRKAHIISSGEALKWTAFWVTLSLLFMGAVYVMYQNHWAGLGINVPQLTGEPRDVLGLEAATVYITGYLVEQSLSLDNMFVIAMIFGYFRVPAAYQHRVLFWGILGAIIARGTMILVGVTLIKQFSWMTYVFGGFLLVSAVKMLVSKEDDPDLDKKLVVRLAKKIMPLHPQYEGTHFLWRVDHKLFMTPMLLVLLTVESADVVFAVDSIPAIFSVTRDPFIIFTSNVFAILGLRSLYFALAGVMHRFKFVKASLVFVLAFIGVKMLISHHYHIDHLVSLSVIAGILCIGVLASVIADRKYKDKPEPPFGKEIESFARMALRSGWKLLIFIVGTVLLIAAVPIGFLPGPGGVFVAIAGLMVLAIEFEIARRMLKRVRAEWNAATEIAGSIVGIKPKHSQQQADQSTSDQPNDPLSNPAPDQLVVRKAYSRIRLALLWFISPFSRRAREERGRIHALMRSSPTAESKLTSRDAVSTSSLQDTHR